MSGFQKWEDIKNREEPSETRGLSQRELLLELRQDVKDIKEDRADDRLAVEKEIAAKVSRKEMFAYLGGLLTLAIGLGSLLTAG